MAVGASGDEKIYKLARDIRSSIEPFPLSELGARFSAFGFQVSPVLVAHGPRRRGPLFRIAGPLTRVVRHRLTNRGRHILTWRHGGPAGRDTGVFEFLYMPRLMSLALLM